MLWCHSSIKRLYRRIVTLVHLPKQRRLCEEVDCVTVHLFSWKEKIVTNIKTEQARFRCSVRRLNERFPTTKLKRTQSDTEGDGETLLCEATS